MQSLPVSSEYQRAQYESTAWKPAKKGRSQKSTKNGTPLVQHTVAIGIFVAAPVASRRAPAVRAFPHLNRVAQREGHQNGEVRDGFVPAIILQKLRAGAQLRAKVGTARRRHERLV